MADNTLGNAADNIEGAGKNFLQSAWNGVKGAARIAKPVLFGTAAIAALSFAMDPTLLASVASDLATQEAATTLTGAVGQSVGNVATYVGTGVMNSGPVWEAAGSGIADAAGGLSDWWSGTDFTPA